MLLWLSYFVMLGLYAVACGAYLAALLGLPAGGPWPKVFASVVAGFAALNLAGAQLVGRAESVLVYFKLAVLVVFCAGGLAFVHPARVAPAAFPSADVIVYAGALIFLGYEGFELIANASEDARDPARTLPRAYAIAIGGVIALYVLVAFVAVGNLSPHAIAAESDYALAAAHRPDHRRPPGPECDHGIQGRLPRRGDPGPPGVPDPAPRSAAQRGIPDPTSEEWAEFLGHFELRKVATGTCGRAFGTPCIHEHSCLRCSMHWPSPAQRPRIAEIRDKLAQIDRRSHPARPVNIGMPAFAARVPHTSGQK